MLQRATSANAKMRAARCDPIGGWRQNIDQPGFVHVPAPLENAQAHTFRRQRAIDEHRLAVDARHAAAVVGEIDDIGFLHRA